MSGDIYDRLTDPSRFILDGCGTEKKGKKNEKSMMAMMDSVSDYVTADLKLKAAAAVQQWADSDVELGEGETYADRLYALLVGAVDANMDGEVNEDEAEAFNLVCNFALGYMTRHGVNEDDAVTLLNDFDNDTAERVRDFLIESLPDDDAAGDDMDSYVFDSSDNEDDYLLDAVYKKTTAIRGGKKVRINKRISGSVHLSGAQKAAIRKAQRKSHSAASMMKRAKSMRLRIKTGLNK